VLYLIVIQRRHRMVAKRGTKAVKRNRTKSIKAKSVSAKRTKDVKGGAVDSFIHFGSQADWSGPGDSPSPQINWGDGRLKGKI
jgi:hypothetical protein